MKLLYDSNEICNLSETITKKYYISKNITKYYFIMDEHENADDLYLAQHLHISYQQYRQIILKHNGSDLFNYADCLIFTSKEDCESTIEELQPYIVMNTLKGW